MICRLSTILALAVYLLAGAGPARADVVETRDGRRLEGSAVFVEGAVLVKSAKKVTKLKLEDVASLQRDAAAPTTAPAHDELKGLMIEYFSDPQCQHLCAIEPASRAWFDWPPGPPNADTPAAFTARITGWLVPRQTRQYTLGIENFSRAEIGPVKLGGKETVARDVKLEAGQRVPILLQVTRSGEAKDGHTRCKLWWSAENLPGEDVPEDVFRRPDDFVARLERVRQDHLAGSAGGWKGEYFTDKEMHDLKLVRLDPWTNHIWGFPGQIGPAFKKNVAIRWTGRLKVPHDFKATFRVTGRPLRFWLDGKLLIDAQPKSKDKDKDKDKKEEPDNQAIVDLKKDRFYDLKMEYTAEGVIYRDVRLQWNERFAWFHSIPSSMLYPPPDVPRVEIVLPLEDARVDAMEGLPVHIVATPGKGTIKKVELFMPGADGTHEPDKPLAELTAPPFHTVLHPKTASEWTLQARVTNSQGAMSLSAPVKLAVVKAPSEELGKGWTVARIGRTRTPIVEKQGAVLSLTGMEGSMGEQAQMPLAAQMLRGNGELIAHLSELKTDNDSTFPLAGVTVRGEVGTQSPYLALVVGRTGGWFVRHAEQSSDSTYVEKPIHLPAWLRLVRSGAEVRAYWSSDKDKWTLAGSAAFKEDQDLFIGVTAFSLNSDRPTTGVFDHVSLTSGAQADLASGAGVQLIDGSILYGTPSIEADTISVRGADGQVRSIRRDQVARLFFAPVGSDVGAALTPGWRGAIVRNDLIEGEVSDLNSDGANVSSVLFGIQSVRRQDGLRALVVRDVTAKPGAIAVQYTGGLAMANDVRLEDNKLVIPDAAGGELRLPIGEILSLRRSP